MPVAGRSSARSGRGAAWALGVGEVGRVSSVKPDAGTFTAPPASRFTMPYRRSAVMGGLVDGATAGLSAAATSTLRSVPARPSSAPARPMTSACASALASPRAPFTSCHGTP